MATPRTSAATSPAKAPSKAEIQKYLDIDKRRREADRTARALDKEQKALGGRFLAYVDENGGKQRSTIRCGYLLKIVEAKGTVSWKDAFVEVAGEEEAVRRMEACPLVDRLAIEIT